jgi:hypothetical protein
VANVSSQSTTGRDGSGLALIQWRRENLKLVPIGSAPPASRKSMYLARKFCDIEWLRSEFDVWPSLHPT